MWRARGKTAFVRRRDGEPLYWRTRLSRRERRREESSSSGEQFLGREALGERAFKRRSSETLGKGNY